MKVGMQPNGSETRVVSHQTSSAPKPNLTPPPNKRFGPSNNRAVSSAQALT